MVALSVLLLFAPVMPVFADEDEFDLEDFFESAPTEEQEEPDAESRELDTETLEATEPEEPFTERRPETDSLDDLFSDPSIGIIEEDPDSESEAVDIGGITTDPVPRVRGSVGTTGGINLGIEDWVSSPEELADEANLVPALLR